jgi:hypothetical protein
MAGEMLELVLGGDKELQAKIVPRIQSIIASSFAEDRSRVTRSEVTRRFRMIEVLLRELRSEHGWAFERILDALPFALRCQLDGAVWDPRLTRNSWSPGRPKL